MAADQHLKSNGGSSNTTATPATTTQVELVTPEQLHKERKSSRNPLKWFQSAGAAASDSDSSRSSSKSTSSSNSKAKPPLVVNYFPTANRPSLR